MQLRHRHVLHKLLTAFVASFLLAAMLTPPASASSGDVQRGAALERAIDALESYARQHGTYQVANAGSVNGNGHGWFHYVNGSTYLHGVGATLVAQGHADSLGALQDPMYQSSSSSTGDFLIYRCKDRVAVFSRHGGDVTASTADRAWWDSNRCPRHPIHSLGATYFMLSKTVSEAQAVPTAPTTITEAMANGIAALESYGAQHGTYAVTNAGAQGKAQGWFHFDGNAQHALSVSQALVDGGHATSVDQLTSPAHIASHRVVGDFLIYRCKDRVGLFTRENNGNAATADRTWWDSNRCPRHPVDALGSNYFQLSKPLAATPATPQTPAPQTPAAEAPAPQTPAPQAPAAEAPATPSSSLAAPFIKHANSAPGIALLYFDHVPGAAGYNVYRDGEYLATTTDHDVYYLDRAAPGDYSYYVTAFDASKNNFSARSNIVVASTDERVRLTYRPTDSAKQIKPALLLDRTSTLYGPRFTFDVGTTSKELRLYRDNVLLTTVNTFPGVTQMTYTDETAVSPKVYNYRIEATGPQGQTVSNQLKSFVYERPSILEHTDVVFPESGDGSNGALYSTSAISVEPPEQPWTEVIPIAGSDASMIDGLTGYFLPNASATMTQTTPNTTVITIDLGNGYRQVMTANHATGAVTLVDNEGIALQATVTRGDPTLNPDKAWLDVYDRYGNVVYTELLDFIPPIPGYEGPYTSQLDFDSDNWDLDNDGIPNKKDIDPDGDGLSVFSDMDNDNDGVPTHLDKDDFDPNVGSKSTAPAPNVSDDDGPNTAGEEEEEKDDTNKDYPDDKPAGPGGNGGV